MNTAPNRRASDNASSPPGTSPTRRFSDMLKESSGSAGATRRVVMTAQDETVTLQPNVLYVFPEMANLTITLAAITDNTIANEYHFFFTSSATATVTNFPAIPGLDSFAAEANMVYEVSILEAIARVDENEVTA